MCFVKPNLQIKNDHLHRFPTLKTPPIFPIRKSMDGFLFKTPEFLFNPVVLDLRLVLGSSKKHNILWVSLAITKPFNHQQWSQDSS